MKKPLDRENFSSQIARLGQLMETIRRDLGGIQDEGVREAYTRVVTHFDGFKQGVGDLEEAIFRVAGGRADEILGDPPN